MATQPQTLYTYADLERFPEDNLRREIIDGELIVTPSPVTRHQDAVMTLGGELYQYVKAHGGKVYPAPLDVFFSDHDVVQRTCCSFGPSTSNAWNGSSSGPPPMS